MTYLDITLDQWAVLDAMRKCKQPPDASGENMQSKIADDLSAPGWVKATYTPDLGLRYALTLSGLQALEAVERAPNSQL
jgi:hypothetical protein